MYMYIYIYECICISMYMSVCTYVSTTHTCMMWHKLDHLYAWLQPVYASHLPELASQQPALLLHCPLHHQTAAYK